MCSARIAANEGAGSYERHRPEKMLLYQKIDEYYRQFLSLMEQHGCAIPRYVQREFDEYLECGRLEHGFFPCAARAVIISAWRLSVVPPKVGALRRATRNFSQLCQTRGARLHGCRR